MNSACLIVNEVRQFYPDMDEDDPREEATTTHKKNQQTGKKNHERDYSKKNAPCEKHGNDDYLKRNTRSKNTPKDGKTSMRGKTQKK